MILNTIRSLRWADFFIYSVTDPRNLFRRIEANDPKAFGLSFVVPFLVSISEILSTSLLGQQTAFFYYKLTYGWIFNVILLSFFIIITASLMDLMAQFLGFEGKIKNLVCIINFSIFPKVFLLPLVYIFKSIGFAPAFFYFFFSLIFFVWSAFIAIFAISEMHRIDTGRAILVFLFPILFTGVVVFFLTVLTVIGGVTMLFS